MTPQNAILMNRCFLIADGLEGKRPVVPTNSTAHCAALRSLAARKSHFRPQVGSGEGSAEPRVGCARGRRRAPALGRPPHLQVPRARGPRPRRPPVLLARLGAAAFRHLSPRALAGAAADAPPATSGAGCLATARGRFPLLTASAHLSRPIFA